MRRANTACKPRLMVCIVHSAQDQAAKGGGALIKGLCDGLAKALLNRCDGCRAGEGGHVVLQRLQLLHELRRQHVHARAELLACAIE